MPLVLNNTSLQELEENLHNENQSQVSALDFLREEPTPISKSTSAPVVLKDDSKKGFHSSFSYSTFALTAYY